MNREFPKPNRDLVHYHSLQDDMLIVVFDGEHYRDQNAGPAGPPLDSFNEKDFIEVGRIRSHACEYGNYPWDHWQKWALEDDIPEDLAGLGRSLIREADQHNWSKELQTECGWSDSGAAMIELALSAPDEARTRWQYLMETDGMQME